MSATSSFDRSCANLAIPCDDGTHYIDPCSCTHYYICASTQKVELQNCPTGTLFHPTIYCDTPSDVSCKAEKPWERCSDVNNSQSPEILEKRCVGASSSSPSSTGEGGSSSSLLSSTGGGGGGGGGENGGAIAGAIVAVFIVIVFVVCIVLYVRKRGNPIRLLKQKSFWRGMTRTGKRKENGATCPAVHVITPPPEPEEEVYTHIDDVRDSQLITVRPTAPPREVANNTNHQQNNYMVMPRDKRQSPEQRTPNFSGNSKQTQDLVSKSKQTEDLVSLNLQTQDLASLNPPTQDLASLNPQTQDFPGHTKQKAVTDKSLSFYSPLEEDSLDTQPYDVLDHSCRNLWRDEGLHNTGLAEEGSLGRSGIQDDQYSMEGPVTLDNGDYTGQNDPEYFELE